VTEDDTRWELAQHFGCLIARTGGSVLGQGAQEGHGREHLATQKIDAHTTKETQKSDQDTTKETPDVCQQAQPEVQAVYALLQHGHELFELKRHELFQVENSPHVT